MVSDDTLKALLEFRRQRDWEQFHTPKNLAIAISVEASELLEQFQWARTGDVPEGEDAAAAIRAEIADVAILVSYLAHDLKVDLDEAVRHKLQRNSEGYSVETSQESARKAKNGSSE